jgi:hypothetical protein
VLAAAVLPGPARPEEGADGRLSERRSSHFVLRQDVDLDERSGFRGSRRFEQEVLGSLERAYDRLGATLGLRPERPIEVLIYDPRIFDASYAGRFAFPVAGFYHGVVRVRGDVRITVELERVLQHELVHAAFDAAAPSLVVPGWVNEGLAQWFEQRALGKRHLDPGERAALARAEREGRLPGLAALAVPSFAGFGDDAGLAYLVSYAAIEHLARRYGEAALARFCDELLRTRSLEHAMERVFRSSPAELEAELAAANLPAS